MIYIPNMRVVFFNEKINYKLNIQLNKIARIVVLAERRFSDASFSQFDFK